MLAAPIFLDFASTTPTAPEVIEAMLPYFYQEYGNPSSKHCMGKSAGSAVDWARACVAGAINADPGEIYFTSGATESCNLAIFGSSSEKRRHFVTTAIEHKAVLEPMRAMEAMGHELTIIQPRENGCIEPNDVISAIRPDTYMCSMMAVNNEVGTIQPIEVVAPVCRNYGVLFHCDATQGFAKIPIDVSMGIDLLSMSAHKIYGPKGVGALYKRDGVEVLAQSIGGSQEEGIRPGTLNVPGIVGMATATNLCLQDMDAFWTKCEILQSMFLKNLGKVCRRNGCEDRKVPWILNISIPNSDARALTQIDGLCISKSSACAKSDEPSHVLASMGLDEDNCRCAIRISFGRATTEQEVVEAARMIRGN